MKLLSSLLVVLILSTSALAREPQGPPASPPVVAQAPLSDAQLQTALRKALEEVEQRRLEVAALKEAGKAKDEHVKSLEAIIANQAQLVDLWRTAATERAGANALDAKIEQLYKESVSRYAVELAAVRIDRDKQASQKKWWLAAGIVIGAVAGVFAAKD